MALFLQQAKEVDIIVTTALIRTSAPVELVGTHWLMKAQPVNPRPDSS